MQARPHFTSHDRTPQRNWRHPAALVLLACGALALTAPPAGAQVLTVSIAGPGRGVGEGEDAVFTVRVAGTTTEAVHLAYTVSASGDGAATAGDLGNSGEEPDTRPRNTVALASFPTAVAFEIPSGIDGSAEIRLPIFNDAAREGRETLTVTLSAPTGGGNVLLGLDEGRRAATATIAMSDAPTNDAHVFLLSPSPTGADCSETHVSDDGVVIPEGEEARFRVCVEGTIVTPVALRYSFLDESSITDGDENRIVGTPSVPDPDRAAASSDDLDISSLTPRCSAPALSCTFELQIAPGDGSRTLEIPFGLVDDLLEERFEIFAIQLLRPPPSGLTFVAAPGGEINGDRAAAAIAPSDAPGDVSIVGPRDAVAEGGDAVFTVRVAGTTTETVMINYTVSASGDGAATPGDLSSGGTTPTALTSFPSDVSLTIPAGTNESAVITLPVLADGVSEGQETFIVTLESPMGGGTRLQLNKASDTATIAASGAPGDVSIAGPRDPVAEGGDAVFTVTVAGTTTMAVTVNYTVSASGDGAATPGDLSSGGTTPTALTSFPSDVSLTIPAGTNESKTITLPVLADGVSEGQETFTVTLKSPRGGGDGVRPRLDTASATATIAASGGTPVAGRPTVAVSIAGPEDPVAEGRDAEFTVTVAGTTTMAVTVNYTVGASGDGAATPGDLSDGETAPMALTSFPSDVSLTIPAGTNESKTITLPVFDDAVSEGPETFTVTLESPRGGGDGVRPRLDMASTTATATIAASDAPGDVSIAGPRDPVAEGSDAAFTVTVAGTTTMAVTVNYTVRASGDGAATPGDLSSGGTTPTALTSFPSDVSLTIPAGTNESATITLPVFDDTVSEGPETLTVTLKSPRGGGGGVRPRLDMASTSATATIRGSDRIEGLDLIQMSADPGVVSEGETASFKVTLRGDTPTQQLDLERRIVSLEREGANVAETGDFEPGTPLVAPLSFAAGQTSGTFAIKIAEDGVVEGDEQFTVEVATEAGSARVASDLLATTIEDDDVGIAIRAISEMVSEGSTAIFVLTRTGDLGPDVTVAYTVEESEEIDAADYEDQSGGSVSLLAGQTTAEIRISIRSDGVTEEDETLRVTVSNPTSERGLRPGGSIELNPDSATVTIPRLEIGVVWAGPQAVEEGEQARFEVELQLTPEGAVTPLDVVVGYELGGAESALGSQNTVAERGVDYTAPPVGAGILVIPAGQREGSFAVSAIRDGQLEDVEVFSVALAPERSSGGGGTLRVTASPRLVRILDGADQAQRREERTRGLLATTHRSAANMATEVITSRLGRGDLPAQASANAGRESSGDLEGANRAAMLRAGTSTVAPPTASADQGPTPTEVTPHKIRGRAFDPRAQRGEVERSRTGDVDAQPGRSSGALRRAGDRSDENTAVEGTTTLASDALGTALRLTGLSGAMPAGRDPAAPDSESTAMMAGIDTPVRPFATGPAEASYGADTGAADRDLEPRWPDLGQLLKGARFELSGEEMGWGGFGEGLAVWGAGAFQSLEGDPVLGSGRLDYDGRNYGLFVGADKRLTASGGGSELLAGAALGWTRADLDFRDEALRAFELEGRLESELLTIHPYAALRLSPSTQLWLVAGYGWGDVEIEEREERPDRDAVRRRVETDSTMWMVSAGAEGSTAVPGLGEASQLTARLQGTRTGGDLDRARFDDGALLRGTRARTWRVAGELEGSYRLELSGGGSFRPFVTTRLRGDAGDDLGDDWEFAVDVGGGAELAWPERGLALGLKGLAQLNQGTGRREHSLSLNLNYDLDWDDRGLTVSMESALAGSGRLGTAANRRGYGQELVGSGGAGPGGFATRGEDGIGNLGGGRGSTLRRSLRGEVGYGLLWPSFGSSGLLTPYARFELAPRGHSYGAGLRFEAEGGISLGVEGAVEIDRGTTTDSTDQPDYQLRLKGEMEF